MKPFAAWLSAGALLALGPAASAATPVTYTFGAQSEIAYHVVHPMHKVKGVSHALDGRVELTDGRISTPLTLKLPLISFNSGNPNRDSNAAGILNVARYPLATLEVGRFIETGRSAGAEGQQIAGTAAGKLTIRGVTRAVEVPITAVVGASGLTVDARFTLKLSDYQIERPALMFVPINDEVEVVVHGVAEPTKR